MCKFPKLSSEIEFLYFMEEVIFQCLPSWRCEVREKQHVPSCILLTPSQRLKKNWSQCFIMTNTGNSLALPVGHDINSNLYIYFKKMSLFCKLSFLMTRKNTKQILQCKNKQTDKQVTGVCIGKLEETLTGEWYHWNLEVVLICWPGSHQQLT